MTRMRPYRQAGLYVILIALVILPGCLIKEPLDAKPQLAVDHALLGAWRCRTTDSPEVDEWLEVLTRSPKEYEFVWSGPDGEAIHFRGYASRIVGQTVVNVRVCKPDEEGCKGRPWTFVQYVVTAAGGLVVRNPSELITEDMPQSRARLRYALVQAFERPNAFEDWLTCRWPSEERR